jgi:hypothetical protein
MQPRVFLGQVGLLNMFHSFFLQGANESPQKRDSRTRRVGTHLYLLQLLQSGLQPAPISLSVCCFVEETAGSVFVAGGDGS